MNAITEFSIKNLYGSMNIKLHFEDNTLILVGENGVGKTTVLRLLFYILSGQWTLIASIKFDEVSLVINGKLYKLKHSDFTKPFSNVRSPFLRRFPPHIRDRVLEAMNSKESLPRLEMLCERYDVPYHRIFDQLELFDSELAHSSDALKFKSVLKEIQSSLNSQLLYLPTYRRIEQELGSIFRDFDEREFRRRKEFLIEKNINTKSSFIELIEFGMKDVEANIEKTLSSLNVFARENLNDLTFSYLGDIVDQRYNDVNISNIQNASEQTIQSVLNRIPHQILTSDSKDHLSGIINGIKSKKRVSAHFRVICHYFSKLMVFQEELKEKELKIKSFCDVCNEYMENKEFRYDTLNFQFSIRSKKEVEIENEIKLSHLSSGEKQIVSLFSHLYLSGEEKYFVLIDEPELSLSVPWQRRFLMDITRGNFCSGLVAVTHSPFIYDNELSKYAHGLGEFIL